MRNLLILGCCLFGVIVTGCENAVIVADLECGKDGKLRGDVELLFLGDEESQAELDDATCEQLKEAKKELKAVKFAIGYLDGDDFVPVAFAKGYEVEDENCDGYTDLIYEFSLKKLVKAGLLDESTEELEVGLYVREDCEWVFVESGPVPVKVNYECDDSCEDSKDDCDDNSDCEESKKDCDKGESKKECKENGSTNGSNGDKDCKKDNGSNGTNGDKECKEESKKDCDKGEKKECKEENGSTNGTNGDNGCEKEKKEKDCDNNETPM
jgi:hypothetical protein